jgi:hypothetical protein
MFNFLLINIHKNGPIWFIKYSDIKLLQLLQ